MWTSTAPGLSCPFQIQSIQDELYAESHHQQYRPESPVRRWKRLRSRGPGNIPLSSGTQRTSFSGAAACKRPANAVDHCRSCSRLAASSGCAVLLRPSGEEEPRWKRLRRGYRAEFPVPPTSGYNFIFLIAYCTGSHRRRSVQATPRVCPVHRFLRQRARRSSGLYEWLTNGGQ